MKNILTLFLIMKMFSCYGQTIDNRINDIRNEFKLINSDTRLSKDSIEITNESSEGGRLYFFKDSLGQIRKMRTIFYGETGKMIGEFYISNDSIIFALIQRFNYNRPIYWNDKVSKENGDNEIFDINKSIICEDRYYFGENENLIYWIDKDKKMIRNKVDLKESEHQIIRMYKDIKGKIK